MKLNNLMSVTALKWCRKSLVALVACGLLTGNALADGMIPETSVIIVNEEDGEAAVKVSNSDKTPSLLHVKLQNIPEDPESLLLVTPPVSRVEAGATQQVRFILRNAKQPLKTQRMTRVIFEGIPQSRTADGTSRVGVSVRQNMPVIINPKGLARNPSPWTDLSWSISGGKLQVANNTAYVVRLSQEVKLLPMNASAQLPKSYLLPGERFALDIPSNAQGAKTVRLFPATIYGFAVDKFDASIGQPQVTKAVSQ